MRHCTACCHAGSSAVALSLPTACSLCRKRPGGFLRQVELHSSTHMLLMGSLSAAMTAPSVTKPAAISAVLWLPPGVTPAVCTGHTAPSHCASDAPFGADACKPGSCCCLHGRARSHIDCTACQTQHAPCPAAQAPCRCCPCSCCLAQSVWLTTKERFSFAAYHAGTVQGIIGRTGFSPTEAFRKYLWFALRERKFDQDAVDDLVQLKMSLRLQDSEVGWVTQCSGKACRNFLYVQSALDCA